MKTKELLNQSLPKWPALIVVGGKVTEEQAEEIIIRTTNLEYISTNDHSFANRIYKYIYNLPDSEMDNERHYFLSGYFGGDWNKATEESDKLYAKIKSIAPELECLKNEQIVSCFICGPHGWCDWKGNIFTNSYNIGKWPDCETIYKEWKVIAKAFPFLNLRCQLMSGETCEENVTPVIEFVIKNGKVRVVEPKSTLTVGAIDYSVNFNERGCSFERFKSAFDYVVDKYKEKQ